MKTKTDISYGVIPVRETKAGREFLLIHQYSKIKNNTYWTFPKGHVEGEETPQETAKRELLEETGLSVDTFLSETLFTHEYTFEWKEYLVKKTAAFFLATVKSDELAAQESEVRELRWVTESDVLDTLDYDGNKQLFKAVLKFIEESAEVGSGQTN